MLSMAEVNEQAIREGLSSAFPTASMRPTMPPQQPLASVKAVPQLQASPRGKAAMASQAEQLALIKDTRNMIDRHHKTMHQAFLAMDKARSRQISSPGYAPNPLPPHPLSAINTPLRLIPMHGTPTTTPDPYESQT